MVDSHWKRVSRQAREAYERASHFERFIILMGANVSARQCRSCLRSADTSCHASLKVVRLVRLLGVAASVEDTGSLDKRRVFFAEILRRGAHVSPAHQIGSRSALSFCKYRSASAVVCSCVASCALSGLASKTVVATRSSPSCTASLRETGPGHHSVRWGDRFSK